MLVYRAAMMALLCLTIGLSPSWATVSPQSSPQALPWPGDSVQSLRTFDLLQPNSPPISVYIAPAPPGYRQSVHQALQTWSKALDGRLKTVEVASPSEAQIKVVWVNGFVSPSQGGETEFMEGEATVTIKVNGLPYNMIEGNILHELGHALGIANHSHQNDDIMKSGRAWRSMTEYRNYAPQLSSRDVEAIRRLYSRQWVPNEDLYAATSRQAYWGR